MPLGNKDVELIMSSTYPTWSLFYSYIRNHIFCLLFCYISRNISGPTKGHILDVIWLPFHLHKNVAPPAIKYSHPLLQFSCLLEHFHQL